MSQLSKLVQKFLSKPAEVPFQDVVTLLRAFGYEHTRSKKHHVFTQVGCRPFTIATVKGRRVKRGYIKDIVERLQLEEWYEQNK